MDKLCCVLHLHLGMNKSIACVALILAFRDPKSKVAKFARRWYRSIFTSKVDSPPSGAESHGEKAEATEGSPPQRSDLPALVPPTRKPQPDSEYLILF